MADDPEKKNGDGVSDEEAAKVAAEAERVRKEAAEAAEEVEEVVDLSAVLGEIETRTRAITTEALQGMASKEDVSDIKTALTEMSNFIREAREATPAKKNGNGDGEPKEKVEPETPETVVKPQTPSFFSRLPRWLA